MQHPNLSIAVVMERLCIRNKWSPYKWEAQGVVPDSDPFAPPRMLVEDEERQQWLYPGHRITLYRNEAENYYLNLSAPKPLVFVVWRMQDESAVPFMVTVSYGEAARMMDASEQVDGVPMPRDIADWVGDYVNKNYHPKPRKKIRRNDPFAETEG